MDPLGGQQMVADDLAQIGKPARIAVLQHLRAAAARCKEFSRNLTDLLNRQGDACRRAAAKRNGAGIP